MCVFVPDAIQEWEPLGLAEQLARWKEATQSLVQHAVNDAGKEFSSRSQIGYGLDGEEEAQESDFRAVRGTLEMDTFLADYKRQMREALDQADNILSQL